MPTPEHMSEGKIELLLEDGLRAVINPSGAYVESLQMINGNNLLFARSEIQGKDRGGVFACAPVFGPGDRAGLEQHGFARRADWQVQFASNDAVQMTYEIPKDETSPELTAYAGCAMQTTIELEAPEPDQAILRMWLQVQNRDDKGFVLTPGFHPYFPVSAGSSAEEIVFTTVNRDATTTEQQFNADELKAAQLAGPARDGTIGYFVSNGYDVEIRCNNLPRPVVWTDAPRQYVCFEPTATGPVTSSENKESLEPFILQPGQSQEYFMNIQWAPPGFS